MNASEKKLVHYLDEAGAGEDALARVLQAQIASTSDRFYRSVLIAHLEQTRDHRLCISERLDGLRQNSPPLMALARFWENVIARSFAAAAMPLKRLRGSSGTVNVVESAKDARATEARSIAIYTAIERLARSTGDHETATMAAALLVDEERMLHRTKTEIPRLTEAVDRTAAKRASVVNAGDREPGTT